MMRRGGAAIALVVLLLGGAAAIGRAAGWHPHIHLPGRLRDLFHRHRWIAFREQQHRPVPNQDDKHSGSILFERSILERVYSDSRPTDAERVRAIDVTATRDAYEAVQLGVFAVKDLKDLTVSVSDLRDADGRLLPTADISVRIERYYGASLSPRSRRTYGIVPKTLEPTRPVDVPHGTVRPYWITVHVPADQPGGTYAGSLKVASPLGTRELPFATHVIPITLDEPEILYGTLSINPLAEISHALAQSKSLLLGATIEEDIHLAHADALLTQAEIMLRDQRAHGMNTISPWSAKEYRERDGHPYIADLEVGMALVQRIGFPRPMLYQMGTLLHTNKLSRAGNYRSFEAARDLPAARAIATYYTQRFAKAGLPGIIFLPIEEPNLSDGIRAFDPSDIRQNIGRQLLQAMKEAGARTGTTCTPESARAVGRYADYWIVAHRSFTPEIYGLAEASGAKLAIYANAALMGQNTFQPRFLFGYFVWANHLHGMLPWTYPAQPNRFPRNISGKGEGGKDVHDGFLGSDGNPIPTIQWELSREGVDDAKYLVTLEHLAAKAHADGSAAQRSVADDADAFLTEVRGGVDRDVQKYLFEAPRTYEPHGESGWDAARFASTRARSADLLQRFIDAEEKGGTTDEHG
jgi:hypothetical protein